MNLALTAVGVPAAAATGEAVYQATCNTCHDNGAGLAPRVTHRAAAADQQRACG